MLEKDGVANSFTAGFLDPDFVAPVVFEKRPQGSGRSLATARLKSPSLRRTISITGEE